MTPIIDSDNPGGLGPIHYIAQIYENSTTNKRIFLFCIKLCLLFDFYKKVLTYVRVQLQA